MRSAPTTNPPAADSSPSASVAMNWYEPVSRTSPSLPTHSPKPGAVRATGSVDETRCPSRSHRPATTIGPSSGTTAHSAATSPGPATSWRGSTSNWSICSRTASGVINGVAIAATDGTSSAIDGPAGTVDVGLLDAEATVAAAPSSGRRRAQRSSAAGSAVLWAVSSVTAWRARSGRPSPLLRSSGQGHRRGSTTRWSTCRRGSAPRPARPSAPRRRRASSRPPDRRCRPGGGCRPRRAGRRAGRSSCRRPPRDAAPVPRRRPPPTEPPPARSPAKLLVVARPSPASPGPAGVTRTATRRP